MKVGLVGLLVVAGCASGSGADGNNTLGLGDDVEDNDAASSAEETTTDATTSGTTTDPTAADTTTTADTTEDGTDTETPLDCARPWRFVRDEGALTGIALSDDGATVYAVGVLDSEAWAVALDACDGTVLADAAVAHAGATGTRLDAAVFADDALFAVGSVTLDGADRRNGLYARLDRDDLGAAWTTALEGSTEQDEIVDITLSASGRVWMSGTSSSNAMGTAWTISGSPEGMACGFEWGALGSGSARAITRDGDSLVAAVRTSTNQLVLVRYDQACTCRCQPTWVSDPISVGMTDTSIGNLVAIDGQFYVAGWASDGSTPQELYPHVTWVSSMGVVIESLTDDMTRLGDGYLTIRTDGAQLYLGGARGWNGEPGLLEATGMVRAMALPLSAASRPEWEATPSDLDSIDDLAVEQAPEGFVFLGGNIDLTGTVVRCDKQGQCG